MTDEDIRRELAQRVETDDRGAVTLCFGTGLTLYFNQGYRAEVRSEVLHCFEEYFSVYEAHLRWWVTEGRRPNSVGTLVDKSLSRYLLSPKYDSPDADLTWAFLWHGGRTAQDASPYRIYGFGASRADCEHLGALSFLTMTVPVVQDEERSRQFQQITVTWLKRLVPLHGYGGVAIVTSPDDSVANQHEGQVVYAAKRFPGAEVDYPLSHALFTKQGIKGVNWITVLADAYIDRLGGISTLTAALPRSCAIHRYTGGIAIVCGALPAVGDRHLRIDTPAYRELHRLLAPVRITQHPGVRHSPKGFSRADFEAWLRRFDDA